jgi:hypothetical protein
MRGSQKKYSTKLSWQGRKDFELSISRVRAERFKPSLLLPHILATMAGFRTRDLLTENQAA